ncbi:hypothetical protein [Paenibacillus eucommiae]|uniref:Uncharacterized protein n=1 Tax=Paenibacillus eucommiae TaxID=1355755 RepID=A0ABS4J498_9BACL|nr:hypothetical protein [Paenibacillus eucommiae]MBP1994653.1 hypothetical protein [Paenibacillus eucommiae]
MDLFDHGLEQRLLRFGRRFFQFVQGELLLLGQESVFVLDVERLAQFFGPKDGTGDVSAMELGSFGEAFFLPNEICLLLMLVDEEEGVGAVDIGVRSRLGIRGLEDDADAVRRLPLGWRSPEAVFSLLLIDLFIDN